jgi:hypothetical protein
MGGICVSCARACVRVRAACGRAGKSLRVPAVWQSIARRVGEEAAAERTRTSAQLASLEGWLRTEKERAGEAETRLAEALAAAAAATAAQRGAERGEQVAAARARAAEVDLQVRSRVCALVHAALCGGDYFCVWERGCAMLWVLVCVYVCVTCVAECVHAPV